MKQTIASLALLVLAGIGAMLVAAKAPAQSPPNLSRALDAQRSIVASNPSDAQAHNDLGNLLLLAHEQAQAEVAYRRALELDPSITSARYNLGLLLQQQGALRAALDELQRVREEAPGNAWAHYQIGAIQEAFGNGDRAIKSYARAFALDPQLAFPEVNPQVIDNSHLTQALIVAYRETDSLPQAPYQYEEPGRIVSLLVPPEGTGQTGDEDDNIMVEEAIEDAPTATERRAPGGFPRPGLVPEGAREEEAAPSAGSRVLREGDLDRSERTNQATPGGGSSGQGRVIHRGGQRITPQGYPSQPQQPQGRSTQEVGPRSQESPGVPRYVPPPTRDRFQPGNESTGRLDLRWLPHRATPAAADRAAG